MRQTRKVRNAAAGRVWCRKTAHVSVKTAECANVSVRHTWSATFYNDHACSAANVSLPLRGPFWGVLAILFFMAGTGRVSGQSSLPRVSCVFFVAERQYGAVLRERLGCVGCVLRSWPVCICLACVCKYASRGLFRCLQHPGNFLWTRGGWAAEPRWPASKKLRDDCSSG